MEPPTSASFTTSQPWTTSSTPILPSPTPVWRTSASTRGFLRSAFRQRFHTLGSTDVSVRSFFQSLVESSLALNKSSKIILSMGFNRNASDVDAELAKLNLAASSVLWTRCMNGGRKYRDALQLSKDLVTTRGGPLKILLCVWFVPLPLLPGPDPSSPPLGYAEKPSTTGTPPK